MIFHKATDEQFKILLDKIKNIISGNQTVGNAEKLGNKSAADFAEKDHKHTKSDITDFPTSMPPSEHKHTKSEITDFPTSMPPSEHKHTKSDITDLGDALSGNMKYTDKPSGTYTGDGTSTERTIATGGIGDMLLVWREGQSSFTFVTPAGALVNTGSSWTVYKLDKVRYENGDLINAIASDYLNAAGTTYRYRCI